MKMRGLAKFSPDHQYRYLLGRQWAPREDDWSTRQHWVVWVMLNPSTATAKSNDPTIRNCIYFSQRAGYHGLLVVNLFAYRSPDPQTLFTVPNPVGPDNDFWINWAITKTDRVILAWGNNGRNHPKRVAEVLKLIKDKDLWCLTKTQRGNPCHPARLARTTPLVNYGNDKVGTHRRT